MVVAAGCRSGPGAVRRRVEALDRAVTSKGNDVAKYMLLIYGDPARWDAWTPAERAANTEAHLAFMAAAGERVAGGEELDRTSGATTLRGDEVVTDAPFPETKEALGGFYVIEAADLDEAVALASLLPEAHAGHSGVEIRPAVFHG